MHRPLPPAAPVTFATLAALAAFAALAALALFCFASYGCGTLGTSGTFSLDAAPAGSLDAPDGVTADAGAREGEVYGGVASVTSRVGPDGGTASRLYFAVIGDTRPVEKDDVSGYPSAVLSMIYGRIGGLAVQPSFVVATGDYQFASTKGGSARAQVTLYAQARALFHGPLFPAMGNHECTGATASNCGSGNADGVTDPLRAFEDVLLAPIGKTSPFYEVDVGAPDGSWTSKILVLAGNAWGADQAAWLDAAMARATTYTFVVRHEAAYATTAPGVTPSEAILARHPYTLAICGHKHSYERSGKREIIVGNGGAPLTGSKSYGFAVIDQQADGSLAVDMVDYASGRVDPDFHFVVGP